MSRTDRSAHWSRLISEQKQSGESVAAFCRRREVSVPSFYQWRRKLNRVDVESSTDVSSFVPVSVMNSPSSIEFEFPGGVVVRLPRDRELLREFLDIVFDRVRVS